jgi:ATP-dependent DNA ligase
LQDISGESRNEETSEESGNEYHLYDCFYLPTLNSWTFETRLEQLNVFKQAIEADPKAKKYIKITPTILAPDPETVQSLFEQFTNEGYEGIMIRNKQGLYLSSPISRSNDLVKMKAKETDEFEIVGFTEGLRGKDKGALIWQVKTSEGKVFNVTPKDMTQEQRKEKFQEFKKSFKFKGHMLTVEYESLSKDKIPQRAKAVAIRDYE